MKKKKFYFSIVENLFKKLALNKSFLTDASLDMPSAPPQYVAIEP